MVKNADVVIALLKHRFEQNLVIAAQTFTAAQAQHIVKQQRDHHGEKQQNEEYTSQIPMLVIAQAKIRSKERLCV